LGGLINTRKKGGGDSAILSSTSRKFLKDTGREMVFVKTSNQFPGSPEEILTRREIKYLTIKIMARQSEKKINRTEIEKLTVKNFKKKFLKEFLEDGQFGARLIWNGKELRNSHMMTEFNFDDNPIVYVFLFKIADKEYETRKITTLKTDPNLGVDFDYFVERNAISEEEVAWKRFSFHGPYIYRTRMTKISDYYLFMREIEYLRDRPQVKADKKAFRGHRVQDPMEDYRKLPKNKEMMFYSFFFFFSFVFSLPSLLLIKLAISRKMRYVVLLGNAVSIMFLILLNMLFGMELWSPIELFFRLF
jgi:hypothetical protein